MATTHYLTRDEFEALEQVLTTPKPDKISACVARNGKRLVGIKLLMLKKDGHYALTDRGNEALFVNKCLTGLRAAGSAISVALDPGVANFLGRKGHVVASNVAGQFEITAKGRACLEDIALNP